MDQRFFLIRWRGWTLHYLALPLHIIVIEYNDPDNLPTVTQSDSTSGPWTELQPQQATANFAMSQDEIAVMHRAWKKKIFGVN